MSEPSTETVISSPQGVMPGVEPAARVPSITSNSTNVTTSRQPSSKPDGYFTAEDVERIRQQEKDKVYGRIDELTQRLRVFEDERAANQQAEEQRRKEAEEAERKRLEAETDTRTLLEQKEQEWREQLRAEREERERAFALLEKEREYARLQQYKADRIREHEDEILPELQDEVSGNTTEEIDASIARLVAKTASILENVGAVVQTQRQQQPGARVTAPPVGPLETETSYQSLTPQQIAEMPMDQFAQMRGKLGVTGGKTHRGLFD